MRIDKFFSFFLAIYPVLCLYAAFSSFTIGDVCLIVFIALFILMKRGFKMQIPLLVVFVSYIMTVLVLRILSSGNFEILSQGNAALIRGLKLTFYTFGIITVGSSWFDIKTFGKYSICVGVIASGFMILQYISFWVFGYVLLGQIPGLPLHLEEYAEIEYGVIFEYLFRPSSIFLEPAMFTQYMMIPLSIIFFTKDEILKKGKILLAIFFSGTIIMSTSGQGVLYLAITYLIYVFVVTKKKSMMILLLLSIIIIVFIGYGFIEPFQLAADRLLFGEGAQEARLGSYRYCIEQSEGYMIFGHGYGIIPNNEYLAGGAYVWYGGGIIGLCLSICIYASFFVKCNNMFSKFVCLIFFVMFWGTALFYNYMFFWFFSIVCGSLKYNLMNSKNYIYRNNG